MSSFYSFTNCNEPPSGVWPNARGVSAIHGHNSVHEGETVSDKSVLYKSWKKTEDLSGKTRAIGGFRFYNHAGDALSREDYNGVEHSGQCGNQLGGGVGKMHSPRCRRGRSQINSSGVETFSGNPKYVYDSSNYMTYKKRRALNKGYGDIDNLVYAEGGGSRCETVAAKNRSRK